MRKFCVHRAKQLTAMMALLILCLTGCVKRPPQPETTTTQNDLIHAVSFQGETLALISSWYTGNAENWRAIVDYNPGLQVTKIRIGDKIKIPAKLVIKRDPLTAKSWANRNSGAKKSGSTAPNPTERARETKEKVSPAAVADQTAVAPRGTPDSTSTVRDLPPAPPPPNTTAAPAAVLKETQEDLDQVVAPKVQPPATPTAAVIRSRDELLEELLN
jgi:hypothetical protein